MNPHEAPKFFADAMAKRGRCRCGVDADGTFCGDCRLCAALPTDWPCPTIDHSGYPLPTVQLARDAANSWVEWRDAEGNSPVIDRGLISYDLSAALDRLAAVYGTQGPGPSS
jgi:hypothetical protein